jgi:hypothetical protein
VFSEGGFSPTDVDLFERAGGDYEVKGRVQHERPELVGKAISVRSRTHTYVYRQCERDELYDRIADPVRDDQSRSTTRRSATWWPSCRSVVVRLAG